MNKTYRLLLVSALALIVAACSGSSDSSTAEPTVSNNNPTAEVETANDDFVAADPAPVDFPAWYTATLTDVRTDETFSLADFQGQAVFVETMATWCSNCRRQLQNVRTARDSTEGGRYVFVALSLETNLSDGELADYTDNEGFDWTFAVMSADMLRAFVDQFGRSVSTAPSTPHFIIRPDGSFTDLVTGIESADQLTAQLSEASGT